jgi:hypothetical protein
MKGNEQKKAVFQDNFIKHYCKSAENHPEGWSWWKRKVRKDYRRFLKEQTKKMIDDYLKNI